MDSDIDDRLQGWEKTKGNLKCFEVARIFGTLHLKISTDALPADRKTPHTERLLTSKKPVRGVPLNNPGSYLVFAEFFGTGHLPISQSGRLESLAILRQKIGFGWRIEQMTGMGLGNYVLTCRTVPEGRAQVGVMVEKVFRNLSSESPGN